MNSGTWLRWLQRGFLLVGILLIATRARSQFESQSFQSSESKRLDTAVRQVRHPAASKGVLGRVEIPRLGITAMIAEGSDSKTLKRAVGHITSTALPGRPGNCALAGHRDSFFRGLGGVEENDLIRIVTPEQTYTYQVQWTTVVEPRRVEVLDSTDTRALTLVTCYPFRYVGHAPNRFVVRAVQVRELAERVER